MSDEIAVQLKQFFLSWGLTFLAAFADAFSAFIVKWQYNRIGEIDYSTYAAIFNYLHVFFSSPIVIIAFILFLLAPVFWFVALNRIQLSLGYPILISLHLLFIIFFSMLILKEHIDNYTFAGIGCILLSLFFFYKSER